MIQLIAQSVQNDMFRDCRIPEIDDDAAGTAALNDCRIPEIDDDAAGTAALASSSWHDHAVPLLQHVAAHPLLQRIALDADHDVAYVPSHSQVVVLNQAAQRLLTRLPLGTRQVSAAEYRALALLHHYRLVIAPDAPLLLPPQETTTLVAWLHMTNVCNVRCAYCYVPDTDQAARPMSGDTARAAIDMLMQTAVQHGYRTIALKYAGGEPTLQLPLVLETQRYALRQAAQYGVRVVAGLLSNGTRITAQAAQLLATHQIQLTISLDGEAATHNRSRPLRSGAGSFAAVQRGIDHAMQAGLQPDIAITLTRQTIDGLPDLLAWLLRNQLRFMLSFARAPVQGGAAALHLDNQTLIAGMRRAYAVISQNLPRWSLLGMLLDRADLSVLRQHACAAGRHYLVIDAQGQVAPCQMLLQQPVTSLAAPDPLTLVRAYAQGAAWGPVDAKAGCQDCRWRYWCGGGCAVTAQGMADDVAPTAPYCQVYQALFPDVLSLEGRRLLHWQAATTL
jgi:uncharacterized protein